MLDKELPGGGWPTACLSEVLPAHEGIGELRLMGPGLACLSSQGRRLAWVAPPYLPYAPALDAAGIELERLLIVRTRTAAEALWAAEQALRSQACGAVLLWSATCDHAALRRLQLAAEHGRALALLFRPPTAHSRASPAALRLRLDSANGGLAVHILKRRGPPLHRPVFIPCATAAEGHRPVRQDSAANAPATESPARMAMVS